MLIIANKNIYNIFPYPLFVTGSGQVFSALGGLAMARMGLATLQPMPPLSACVWKLGPIVASSTATMFCGNAAYLHLSVAFIQILKSFTPALTMCLCVIVGLERMQAPLVWSLLLIAVGTSSAVLVESATPTFQLIGILLFLGSSSTEAARVVGTDVLLSSSRFNPVETLVYVGAPTAAVLLMLSLVFEGEIFWGSAGALLVQHPVPFLYAFALSFLVNLSAYFAIQSTSSLTFKVAGCLKNLGVILYGMFFMLERVTLLQFVGYGASVAGFALYTHTQLQKKLRAAAKE